MEQEVTILSLNDDCLLHIIKLLSSKDQAQLKRVCPRFEELVNSHWRLEYKEWICDPQDRYRKAAFSWMVFHVHDFVQILDLGIITQHDLDMLATTKFPNTHTLIGDANNILSKPLNFLVDTFPNLNTLTLEANLELDAISRLEHLTELKLEYSCYEGVLDFEVIFTKLKLKKFSFGCSDVCQPKGLNSITQCTTLEEVSTNAEILHVIAPMLDKLPRLHMIACYAYGQGNALEDSIFETVVDLFGKRIRTLISDNIIKPFPMNSLANMENLECWIMKDVFVSSFEKDVLASNLKNLHELILINEKTIKPTLNGKELLTEEYISFDPLILIAACSQLRVLAIPFEWISEVINLNDLCDVLRKREKKQPPLELRCLYFCPKPEIVKHLCDMYSGRLEVTIAEYPTEELDRYSTYYYSYRIFQIYLNS